jgi:hypothetical protein
MDGYKDNTNVIQSNVIQSNVIQSNETQQNIDVTSESSSSASSISSDSDYENYVIKANVCTILSKELNLEEIIYDIEYAGYEPPKEHGLTNCNAIIPAYYKLDKDPSKIFEINYFDMIKDDIRNLRPLNKYQINYIKNLSHEEKNDLFDIFNECVRIFNETM